MSEIKIELIAPFMDATKETLKTMANKTIRRKEVYLKKGYAMYGEVSGMIGLSGVTTGTCAISMPANLARHLVAEMLMIPNPDLVEANDVRDGVGEFMNMIAGGAKTRLSSTRYKFDITLPTIISGGPHEMFHRTGTHCVVIVFAVDDLHAFALDVAVKAR
ncbi:MAG: chemotaxis protein CheX [Candidatus Hydrogenedentes bacterium]|nr:chemotaxis protein CheX [Candidatus Hydrogenedentota bacterium]